jgi:hypothetical protein
LDQRNHCGERRGVYPTFASRGEVDWQFVLRPSLRSRVNSAAKDRILWRKSIRILKEKWEKKSAPFLF